MRRFGARAATDAVGVAIVLSGLALCANAQEARRLTDNQLDRVTAGITASASGSGTAKGALSGSASDVNTTVTPTASQGTLAAGQVTASAVASGPGTVATASSVLVLSVVSP